MPRINVPFVVEKQRIALLEPVELVAGGQNYFYATFNLCKTWKKISGIKALFTRGDISKLMTLTEGDGCMECQIPWEVMEDMGVFHVGIFGGDRLLTNMTYVVVRKGCLTEGGLPEEPTPDWFKIIEEEIKKAERVSNKVTVLNDKVTDDQYPSAKAVWDVLKNTGGNTDGVSDFIELNIGSWGELDNINHHKISYSGSACNLFYKGIYSGYMPYVLLVQIAEEDVTRTYQTIWRSDAMALSSVYETRCYGVEFGGDDTYSQWTEWKEIGGSSNVDTSKFEKVSNKVTAIDENADNDHYPTAKAVADRFVYAFDIMKSTFENYATKGDIETVELICGQNYSLCMKYSDSVDDLTSTDRSLPLSANQGRVLNEKIGDIDKALEDIIKIQNQLMGVSE